MEASSTMITTRASVLESSKILDGNGKASVRLILQYRDTLQSGVLGYADY
jgi:hypothetical protein